MNLKRLILLVAGLFIGYTTFFQKDNFSLANSDLAQIQLTVKNVSDIGSKHAYEKYKIIAKNFPCEFVIDNSGGKASDWTIEDHLSFGDKIDVGIDKADLNSIKKKTRVRIYSLKKNEVYIFTLEDYKRERNSRDFRYKILGYVSLVIIAYYLLKADKKRS